MLAVVLPEVTFEYFWEHLHHLEGKLSRVYVFAAFMQPVPVGPVAEHSKKVMGPEQCARTEH